MKKLIKSFGILIFFLILFLGKPINSSINLFDSDLFVTDTIESNIVECSILNLPLTLENVIIMLKRYDIKHPEVVVRQIQLETGHLKSKGATIDNNLFGFRKQNYMTFDNWVESVEYYKRWQDKKYKGGNYYTFLQNVGYAKDSLYIQKLKSIKHNKNIKSLINQ